MKKASATFLLWGLLASLSFTPTFGCTTFCLKNKGEVLFGKNYDWNIGNGLSIFIFTNRSSLRDNIDRNQFSY